MPYNKNGTIVKRDDPWYRNQTFLWILKSTAVNFVLPFFNGVMLGFGEILSNEVLFRYGWFGYSRPSPIGVYGGIPSSATAEYKKTIQNEIKREQKHHEQELLLLD
jgi:hypothetical protein